VHNDIVVGSPMSAILPATPTRTGMHFKGWNTAADGSGASIGDAVLVAQTYYAQWDNRTYITFNAYHGKFSDNSTSKVVAIVYPNSTFGDGEFPVPPTLPGFTFDGWWTGRSEDAINNNTGGTLNYGTELLETTPVNADMTVYARWSHNTALGISKIEYVLNAGGALEARVTGTGINETIVIPVQVTNNSDVVQNRNPNTTDVNGITVVSGDRINLGPIFGVLFSGNEWTLEYYVRVTNNDSLGRFGRIMTPEHGGMQFEGQTHYLMIRQEGGGTNQRRTATNVGLNNAAGWMHIAFVVKPGSNECFTFVNGIERDGSAGGANPHDIKGWLRGNPRFRTLYYNYLGGTGQSLHGITFHNTAKTAADFLADGVLDTLAALRGE